MAVWLPSTKSQESTRFPCVHAACNISTRAITLLQTSSQSEVCTRSYAPPKSWDSHLGVLGQIGIWMGPPWVCVEVIIWGKVVASPKSGPWWVLWVKGYLWFVLAPKVFQVCTNRPVLVLSRFVWVLEAYQFFLVPSRSSNTPLYPWNVTSQRACLDSLLFHCFQFRLTFESLEELGARRC